MTNSKYTFERTELRVLQNTVDNETFLNLVSNMIGSINDEIKNLKDDSHKSWVDNFIDVVNNHN